MLLLSSCTKVLEKTKIEYVVPPEEWMMSEEIPAFTGETNGDLIDYTLDIYERLERANIHLDSILEWSRTYGQ